MIQIGKGEVKISLFADDMMLCIKDPKTPTRKLLEQNQSIFEKEKWKQK